MSAIVYFVGQKRKFDWNELFAFFNSFLMDDVSVDIVGNFYLNIVLFMWTRNSLAIFFDMSVSW